jgi:hypothetical protein
MVNNHYESQFITNIIDSMSNEEIFGLPFKKEYSSIKKDTTNNNNNNDNNNNNNNNNIMNDNNYESTIIINTMGYEKDFEPSTKKIKLNKGNNYTTVVKPKRIITEEDEETKVKLIRKRKRKN